MLNSGITMIIQTFLDTDLFKLTMMQAVYNQFSDTQAEYRFTCRTHGVHFSEIMTLLNQEINHLCSLSFHHNKLIYLGTLNHFKPDFIKNLSDFGTRRRLSRKWQKTMVSTLKQGLGKTFA